MANYNTKLVGSTGSFDHMMKEGFGIVTVMNADIFKNVDITKLQSMTAYDVLATYKPNTNGYVCTLDTLKVANVTIEGPSKTVTGGQYSNPLIKFGKSARLEMQDALGSAAAIDALCGGVTERVGTVEGSISALHFGEDFEGPKMIIGDSFFIDQKTGAQVPVKIIFYQFLPDSIFNLTQDAEGDATVFDMNGDLLTTKVQVGTVSNTTEAHGIFYSIVDASTLGENKGYSLRNSGGNVEIQDLPEGQSALYSKDGCATFEGTCSGATTDQVVYIRILNKDKEIIDSFTVVAKA